jgi:hypothetical protein
MRCSERWVAAACAALWLTGCSIPTDESEAVSLRFVDPPRQILVGESFRLDVEVTNGGFVPGPSDVVFTSSDPSVVAVEPNGVVSGVGEGEAEITARLTRFESSDPIVLRLFSSRGIVITELVGLEGEGSRLRFGETLEIIGLRLDPDSLVVSSIGSLPAEIVGYQPRDPSDPESLEALRLVVPIVPSGSELLLVHANGGSASRTLTVVQEDVFELYGTPFVVDVGPEGFVAPALTVTFDEDDLMRFHIPAGDWTFEVTQLSGLDFLTNAVFRLILTGEGQGEPFTNTLWGRDHSEYACGLRGFDENFYPARRRQGVDRLVLPLRLEEARTFDLRVSAVFSFNVPYRLELRPGYRADLAPDAAEGNDFCIDAAPIGLGAAQTFNFDTGSDHDWYEFEVPGVPASRAVRTRDEVEPNDVTASGEWIVSGDRIWGERNAVDDVDVFRFEATAGQLIDVEVVGDLLEEIPAGRDEPSLMVVDLRLFAEDGTQLEGGGLAELEFERDEDIRFRGTNALVRWIAPEDGTYTLRVSGEPGVTGTPPLGPYMYYRLDFRLHDAAARVEIEAASTVDPELALVVVESDGSRNNVVRTLFTEGERETMSELVPPGIYRLLTWSALGAGDYALSVRLDPPVNVPWPGAAP